MDKATKSEPIPGRYLGHATALTQIERRLNQCQEHLRNLDNHLENETVPKGLQVSPKPGIPAANSAFLIKWTAASVLHGQTLTKLCQEHWSDLLPRIKKEKEDLVTSLKSEITKDVKITKKDELLDTITSSCQTKKDAPRRPIKTKGKKRRIDGASTPYSGRDRPYTCSHPSH